MKSFVDYLKEEISKLKLKEIIEYAKQLGFNLELSEDKNAVIINWIERTSKAKKGDGIKIIDKIKDYAKENKKEIWIDVDSASGNQVKLFNWYKKQGFKLSDYYEYDSDIDMYMLKDKYQPTKFYPMMIWK